MIFRISLVLFAALCRQQEASVLRGRLDPKVAMLESKSAAHRDVNYDDDMMFEGDVDDESSAEAQLERMHLNDLLGYSAKQAEEDERTDVEESSGDEEEDDADSEAAVDEAMQRFHREERGEEEEGDQEVEEEASHSHQHQGSDQAESDEHQQAEHTGSGEENQHGEST